MNRLISVNVAKDPSNIVYQPADWSIINLPADKQEAKRLFDNLHSMSTPRHTVLALCRHKRRDRLSGLASIADIGEFNYLETVSILYEKPKSCSNNGFLPLSEIGFVLYKGSTPDTNNTKWFNDEYNNATNIWDLTARPGEGKETTYYQRFSWELNFLMMSLCKPLTYRRFVYNLPLNNDELESVFNFCHSMGISAELHTETYAEAKEILDKYTEFTTRTENENKRK